MTRSAVLPAVDDIVRAAATAPVAAPAPAAANATTAAWHTLTVTVRDGGHALVRISAILNNLSVKSLSFRSSDHVGGGIGSDGGLAVCEIVVPAVNSPRAQAKLRRCVEVIDLRARPAADLTVR